MEEDKRIKNEEKDIEETAEEEVSSELNAEIEQLKDQLLRTMAELENVRKRSLREVEDAHKYAISGFCKNLLQVSDTLDRALESVPEEEKSKNSYLKTMCEGVDLTRKEFSKAFEKYSVVKINPEGEKFDHNFHQAVTEVPSEELDAGMVVNVLQPGYKIEDRLLRPAMVTVSKKP